MDFRERPTFENENLALISEVPDISLFTLSGYSVYTNPVSVRTSSTQSISATTNTKLVFGTINHAPNSNAWNSSSNRYVALTDGIYKISGSIRTTGNNRSNKLMLYKNGVFLLSLIDNNTTILAGPTYNGTTDVKLSVNDFLELWFFSSSSTTIANSSDCNFCISRIY